MAFNFALIIQFKYYRLFSQVEINGGKDIYTMMAEACPMPVFGQGMDVVAHPMAVFGHGWVPAFLCLAG